MAVQPFGNRASEGCLKLLDSVFPWTVAGLQKDQREHQVHKPHPETCMFAARMGATKGQLEIAILAWGSLIWEGGREFDDWHDEWLYDGPNLKIEFSRVSDRRLGALTLVIDDECGSPATVAWCRSKRGNIDDAIRDLRRREDTITENIGRVVLNEKGEPSGNTTANSDPIVTWAREKKVDVVVWTALKSNFADKTGHPFSLNAGIAYIKTLSVEGKVRAAEYVWRAPAFVQTPVRTALQQEPWFSKPIA